MKQKILLLTAIGYSLLKGQVGIGTIAPNSKAILDISAQDKGVLFPKADSAALNGMNLGVSENGMLMMHQDQKKIYFWDGAQWKTLSQVKVQPLKNAVFTIDCSSVENSSYLSLNYPAFGYIKVNLIVTEPGNISLQTDYQGSVRFVGTENVSTGNITFILNAIGTATHVGDVNFKLNGGGSSCTIPVTIY